MALKQVVVDRFFEKMILALSAVKQYGPLTLAFLHTPYVTGERKWNLSIAAPWLDELSLRDGRALVNEAIRPALGEFAAKLGFVLVLRSEERVVRTLTPLFDIPELGTAYKGEALELSLFDYDEVVLLISNPVSQPMRLSA